MARAEKFNQGQVIALKHIGKGGRFPVGAIIERLFQHPEIGAAAELQLDDMTSIDVPIGAIRLATAAEQEEYWRVLWLGIDHDNSYEALPNEEKQRLNVWLQNLIRSFKA